MTVSEQELTVRATSAEASAAPSAGSSSRVTSVTAMQLGMEPAAEVPAGAEEWRKDAESRLLAKVQSYVAEMDTRHRKAKGNGQGNGQAELGEPTVGIYVALDVLSFSPLQRITYPPYEPSRIIADYEDAVIWALIFINPAVDVYQGFTAVLPAPAPSLIWGPFRFRADDPGINEFMHGVTNRLVGGAPNVDALDEPQSGGMGEGWGDYVACVVNQAEVVGAWVVDRPGGIRGFPYDERFPDGYGDLGRGRYTGVHAIGEVWCATLMEMTRRIGQPLAIQLVVDALKLSRANPSFLDMRDAILVALDGKLAAGQLDRAGHHAARRGIWTAFARFGMGPAADCVGATLLGIQADFELPDLPPDPEPEPTPEPAPGPAPEPAPEPAQALELVVDELSFQPLPAADGNGGAAERLRAEVAFRVVGPDAAEVAAARSSWSAQILAELPATGETTVLAAVQGTLAPGRAADRAAADLATPPTGRYRLHGVVAVADRQLRASTIGPRLTVLP